MVKKESYNNIFIRSSVQDLGEYALYIYKEILLLYESKELKQLANCNISSKSFKKAIQNKIELKYNDSSPILKGNFELKSRKWILNKNIKLNEIDNKIYFISSGNKIISLLKHLRNAFAHNLIVLDKGYLYIGDFLISKNKPNYNCPTMLGRISCQNLSVLIEAIKLQKRQIRL